MDTPDTEVRLHVVQLLESYHEREQKIALLRYELAHPVNITQNEVIDSMSLGHGDSMTYSRGHISNKTLYIALNYQERAKQLNADSRNEIVRQLTELEHEQDRLTYYVSILEPPLREIIQDAYFKGKSWDDIAKKFEVARRTAHKIRKRAIERLTALYEYADGLR